MKKFILLFIIPVNFISYIYSQNPVLNRALDILEERQELYFYFRANPSEIENLTRTLSVDGYDGKYAYAYASLGQFEEFIKLKRDFQIVESYYNISKEKDILMAATIEEMENWDKYPYFEIYVEMMQNFENDFPDICKLDTIGFSYENRPILVLKITSDINENTAKPEFFYTGQMHGDELVSGILFLRLIDYLLNNYETNEQITKLINELKIYINPYANPDGTWYEGNHSVAESRRRNNQDIDLNRNFIDPIEGDHPDGNEWAVETIAFMEFAESRNFIMSGNSHSGAELMNYPFDTYPVLPADNDWWYFVCREYADTVQYNSPEGYFTGTDNGVTHGYSWYSIKGSRQDYMNYFHHCREVTMELSNQKKIESYKLPDYWSYNKQAFLNYMEQATYGLRGFVTDSLTEEPLRARVFIEDYDFFNSHVYSNQESGDYYRLLYESDYIVKFSADGYRSKSFDINIQNYEQTILDVQLVDIELSPPLTSFEPEHEVYYCNPEVTFINTSETSEDTDFLWDFGDGNYSYEKDPTHIYAQNGIYDVKLIAQNQYGSDSVILENAVTIELKKLINTLNGVICGEPASVELSVNDEGEIYWYENLNEHEVFHTGNTYQTPVLSETTSYYVQSFLQGQEYSLGEPEKTNEGVYITSMTNIYLRFDCYIPCILKSVKVYSSESGERTIYLSNSIGEILNSIDIYIEEGEHIIDLNFDIPVGNDFRLGCNPPSNLFVATDGEEEGIFNYPYSNDFISIKKTNNQTNIYAYFYDWQIKEYDCVSEKTKITAYVNDNVEADFYYSIENNLTVHFFDSSIAADNFLWDFDDGNYSSEKNPVHEYSEQGEYDVSLTVNSECGTDNITKNIYIINTKKDIINSFKPDIYPNPASNIIIIETKENIPLELNIYNIQGMLVYKDILKKNKNEINIQNLKQGLYFVSIKYEDKVLKKKLLITR